VTDDIRQTTDITLRRNG